MVVQISQPVRTVYLTMVTAAASSGQKVAANGEELGVDGRLKRLSRGSQEAKMNPHLALTPFPFKHAGGGRSIERVDLRCPTLRPLNRRWNSAPGWCLTQRSA